MRPDGDFMGFVTPCESPDILLDEEFIDEELAVGKVGRDVPGADYGSKNECAGCPVFCKVRA